MITRYQGESLVIERNLIDILGAEYNLTGSTVDMSYAPKSDYSEAKSKTVAIDGAEISAELTPLETSVMLGWYILEIKIKDANNRVALVEKEEVYIHPSVNPTFGTE